MTRDRPVDSPDQERMLAEALRLMAGGSSTTRTPGPQPSPSTRFTLAQLILIAAIIGVAIGIVAGLILS